MSKKLNLDHIKPVLEIVNFIHTRALNHRQFKNLIAELDEDLPSDLLLHCAVRWLSRGNVLSRFFEHLNPVKLFLAEKHKDYPELRDPQWISDLAFLVDMLHYLNGLNVDLQGKLKMVSDLVQSIFTFVNKLKLFKTHLQKRQLTHFPSLLKASEHAAEVVNGSTAVHGMQHCLKISNRVLRTDSPAYAKKHHKFHFLSTHSLLKSPVSGR